MAASPYPSPGAEREGAERGGLKRKEKGCIAAFLLIGVGLAALLMFYAPQRVVSAQDYRCPSAVPTASSEVTASCLGLAGADGTDYQALSQARTAARTSFGVLSAGLLAGAAAATGVVVSNHNAALTRDALNATVEANKITKDRDETTSTRESDRDRATAARERERAADERFTTAIGQLGHPSASVRLGGMHSLHRLAQSDHDRLPTIVDVLCAYLRQPFHHPAHDWNSSEHPPDAEPPARAWWTESQKERDERDSEREVRSTATRLIPDLLPATSTPDEAGEAPRFLDINLKGAILDGLDLSGRRMGNLLLNGAHIDGNLMLGGFTHITGSLRLGDGAHITGGLWLGEDAHIDDGLMLGTGAHITGNLLLGTGAHITGGLGLGENAHVTGSLQLGESAHITGSLWLGESAHIDGGLRLRLGAHIDGGLRLDDYAHINDNVRLDDCAYIGGDFRLDGGSYITGDLRLNENAYIDGRLWFGDGGSYITGMFVLDPSAHITKDLWLGHGAHIDGGLWLGPASRLDGGLRFGDDAYIGGDLHRDETAVVRGVRMRPKTAMDPGRFQGWDVSP